MIGNPVIRKCVATDESAFVSLNLAFMSESFTEDPFWASTKLPTEEEMENIFREALRMPEYICIFVIECDDVVIGYANTWLVFSIWSRGLTMTIDDLFVTSAYRGMGLGEKMMSYLIDFSRQNGYTRIQLHSGLDNQRAHNLYKKMGFIEEETLFFMKNLKLLEVGCL